MKIRQVGAKFFSMRMDMTKLIVIFLRNFENAPNKTDVLVLIIL